MGELEINFLCGMLQGILVSPKPEVLKVIFSLPSEPQVIPGKFFNNSEIRFFHLGIMSWDICLSYLTGVLCKLNRLRSKRIFKSFIVHEAVYSADIRFSVVNGEVWKIFKKSDIIGSTHHKERCVEDVDREEMTG